MEQAQEKPQASAAATAPKAIVVETDRVPCDGGGGALGHPRVFLTLGEDGKAVCGYCDRIYVRAGSPAAKALAGEG